MSQLKLNNDDSYEFKVEAICNSKVYAKKLENYPPGLYYLVFWKNYPKEEHFWKPASVI